MRRLLYYSLLCLLWISVDSCKDDEVAAPPKPSFIVDKTSGSVGNEFTFTVDQVDAKTISLLPYGTENPSMGGVSIPTSSFTNGKAIVKFSYGSPGVYKAVVVANNHTTDGDGISNTYSDARDITITASGTEISDFSLGILRTDGYAQDVFTSLSTKTTIDKTNKTINVIVRFSLPKDAKNPNYFTDKNKLVATYSASGFSTVTVNGVAQKSGATENNFSSPVDYVVKAQDGTTSTYKVTATFTPVETAKTIKSMTGTAVSKAADKKSLGGYVNEAASAVVLFAPNGTPADQFDSVRVKWSLTGDFATLKKGTGNLKQDTLLNFQTGAQTLTVKAQDSSAMDYKVYGVVAPKLTLSFLTLNPVVSGSSDNSFAVKLNVLSGTDVTAISTTNDALGYNLPAGVSVTGIMITETAKGDDEHPATPTVYTPGQPVDFTKPVKFELTVLDTNIGGGITYKVVYTATVAKL